MISVNSLFKNLILFNSALTFDGTSALYFGDDALDIEKEVARAKSGSMVESEDFTAKLKDIRVRTH